MASNFSDRVACPVHGPVMVLTMHQLGNKGRDHTGNPLPATVEFYKCSKCDFIRPNKYQKRQPGERHK